MVQVLRTMTEVATSETLSYLTQIVKSALDETKFFWESVQENSKLLELVDISGKSCYTFCTFAVPNVCNRRRKHEDQSTI